MFPRHPPRRVCSAVSGFNTWSCYAIPCRSIKSEPLFKWSIAWRCQQLTGKKSWSVHLIQSCVVYTFVSCENKVLLQTAMFVSACWRLSQWLSNLSRITPAVQRSVFSYSFHYVGCHRQTSSKLRSSFAVIVFAYDNLIADVKPCWPGLLLGWVTAFNTRCCWLFSRFHSCTLKIYWSWNRPASSAASWSAAVPRSRITQIYTCSFVGENLLKGTFLSFGMIQIRISDPRSLRSWRIKGTEKSLPRVDSSVPLMRHDPTDLGSLILIWIIPKERTLK